MKMASQLDSAWGDVNVIYHYEDDPREIPCNFPETCLNDETGLYYYGHRFYKPDIVRWASRDPIAEGGFHVLDGMTTITHHNRGCAETKIVLNVVGSGTILSMFVPRLTLPGEEYGFVRNDSVQNIDIIGLAGCSLNWGCICHGGSHLGVKQQYVAIANGCGASGGVPVSDNPYNGPACSFLSACNNHDCCYAQCGSFKISCDAKFRNDMYAICDACTTPGTLANGACKTWANIYYQAVSNLGDGPFLAAQADCEPCCCP